MAFNFFVLGGLLSALALLLNQRRRPILLQLSGAAAIILVFAVVAFLLSDLSFLSNTVWYDRSPWREMILFVLMAVGMLARVVSVAIESRREEIKRLSSDKGSYAWLSLTYGSSSIRSFSR